MFGERDSYEWMNREGKEIICWQLGLLLISVSEQRCYTAVPSLSLLRATPPRGCMYRVPVHCCFTPTETLRTVRDGELRTATSMFSQLLSSKYLPPRKLTIYILDTWPTLLKRRKRQRTEITKTSGNGSNGSWTSHLLKLSQSRFSWEGH